MTALCRAYDNLDDAKADAQRVLSAGLPGTEVQVLMGEAIGDARDAPVGGFAGTATADAATVGAYAGAEHAAREAMGTYAGDAGAQRRGAFADVDRDTVSTLSPAVTRVRTASHDDLRALLVDAGLDEAAARSDVAALHAGRVLVLVRGAAAPDQLAAILDA